MGFLSRHFSGKGPHLALSENLVVFLEWRRDSTQETQTQEKQTQEIIPILQLLWCLFLDIFLAT